MTSFWCVLLLAGLLQLNFSAATVVPRRAGNSPDDYCYLREHVFSYEFDFTVLTNSKEDYVIKHDKDVSLRLQPCMQLKRNCNGSDGYSICLSKDGQEIGIGKDPPKVVMEFGEIIFKYTGAPCDKRQNYTVDIKMKCDFGVKDGNGMELYAAGYNECNFHMNWRTKAACTKPKRMKCAVDDKSGHYDLNELTNFSDNYEVFINPKLYVIINVCHSVIYGLNTCKSNNAACLVDVVSNKSMPLGEPSENLQYNSVDGTLSITYKDGAICNMNSANASKNMQTTITFICDLNAIGTLPQYAGGMDLCHYKISWRTAAACSEQALHNKSLEKANSDVCAVRDPLTGQMYNLTALMNTELTVSPFGTNEVYKLTICNAITNTTCKKGSGACKLHKSVSGGIGNSNLMWKESGPYLNYTNGDLCLQTQRYTIIEIFCGPDDYEIDDDSICSHKIKLSTPLLCKKPKTCTTFNKEISLESLVLQRANYVIKATDETEYRINICQPLVKEANLDCTGKAASICKTTITNGIITSAISLGTFDASPIFTSDRSAVLIYHNGSVCEEDKKRKIESSISFLCDINSQMGEPQFKTYKNCTYFFEWKTSLTCGKIEGYFNENCSINNTLGDFRKLSLTAGSHGLVNPVKSSKSNKMYNISFCGNKNDCNGGFICDDKMNYGTKVSVLYDYAVPTDLIRLHFTEGSKCSDDGSLAQATYTIICKPNSFSSQPVLLREEPCHVEFEWATAAICHSHNVPETFTAVAVTNSKSNIGPNESSSLNGGAIAGIVILILFVVIAIFYLKNGSRRSRLVEMISNSTARNCNRVKYSRVNTMEEVHLLLNASDPTVIDSDSDDDELLDA